MAETEKITEDIRPRLHDVNNCLASILTNVEVLSLEGSSPQETAQCLGDIRAATQRAYRLVSDLMNQVQVASDKPSE